MWHRVVPEPVVRDTFVDGEALIADLGARVVWEPQAMALFDIRVVDTDAKSYLSHSPVAMLASAEAEKKRKYCDACTESVVPPSHRCAFQLIVLLLTRLFAF